MRFEWAAFKFIRIFRLFLAFMVLNVFQLLAEPVPSIRLIRSDATGVILEIEIPAITFTPKTMAGLLFDVPHLEDFDISQEPGQPQLPMKGLLLAVPPQADYQLQILESRPTFLGNRKIPTAPPFTLPHDSIDSRESFNPIFGPEILPNQFFPAAWAEITQENTLRGCRVVRLQINPLQYNPVTGEAVSLNYIKLALRFSQTKLPFNRSLNTRPERPDYFEPIFRHLLLNPANARDWRQSGAWSAPQTPRPVQAILTDNPAYKISIAHDGIYRLTYEWLKSQRVAVAQLDPLTVKILNKGKELPIRVVNRNDGLFQPGDYLQFFGKPNYGDSSFYDAYSDLNVYWLTWGGTPGQRIKTKPAFTKVTGPLISESRQLIHLEKELVYHAGDTDAEIITTEQVKSEGWVWHIFYKGDSQSFPFNLDYSIFEPLNSRIWVRFHGTTLDPVQPDHHLQVKINQNVVGDITFNDREDAIFQGNFNTSWLKSSNNEIQITSLGDLGANLDQVYLDWIDLEVPISLVAHADLCAFQVPNQNDFKQFSIWGFSSDSVQIFEVNQGVQLQPVAIKSEQQLIFKVTSAGYNAGYFARIEINGKAVIDPGRRGINVVVVDSISGRPLVTKDFDTYASALESDSLARFVNRITRGQYVLAAIRDEGSQNLTESARLALESIGSRYIRQVGGRDSWSIIGLKGASKGSVPETYRPDGAGIAVALDTVIANDPQGTYRMIFADSVFQSKRYWVTPPQACQQPQSIVLDTTVNLTNTSIGADYLIITHPKFAASAKRLAAYRSQKNGFRVQIVNIQDIYDEFNFGIPNPRAVKDFLKFTYHYWTPPAPTAVIFLGDASWDLKMNLASSQKSNFVPTYGNPVSDHWFVCLDGPNDLLPEMLTGRIAIETDAQGQLILDKIINYENLRPAKWQKEILFITGGFDAWEQNKFISQAATLNQKYVQPAPAYCRGIMINKTTEGRFEGEKKPEILAAINPGKLWVNFLGHAGSQTWDLMFNNLDVLELTNTGKCPLVTSMTCHTARFANPDLLCFGELFVNLAERGAVAFWGTTGWGYLEQDYILLDKLFPTVLKDTVRTLGSATMLAKMHLWQRYGASLINTNTLQQYTLLGDPVLDLALSPQPELNLSLENIKLNPEVPVETDSLVQIKITVNNFGLGTSDSVEMSVIDINQEQTKTELAPNLKLGPIGLTDSAVVSWPLHGQAGEHRLQITVDPAQKIPESQKTDNSVTMPVFVYSSLLTISKPLNFQVVNTTRTVLQVNTPVKTTNETTPRFYQFELDTTATFQTTTPSTLEIPEGTVVTRWQTPELTNGRTYFWRCRVLAGAEVGKWITSSFHVDFAATGFQVSLRHPQQLAQAVFKNTTPARGGIQLEQQRLVITVQSAGYADGNLARIYLNDRLTNDGTRGYNVTVIDPTNGQVQTTGHYDVWEDPAAADSLAALINRLEAGLYVCAAIKDEGSRYMNENGNLALESIGSQYCRRIGPRDSWAIIGIKGAAIGSVPEIYKPTGTGPVTLSDTLFIYPAKGQIISPVLGPANSWKKLRWFQTASEPFTKTVTQVLGFNLVTGNWDTLQSLLTNPDQEDLTFVDFTRYAKIKLRTTLVSENSLFTPEFYGWVLDYQPVADLATHTRALVVSSDSTVEGSQIHFQLDLFNVGLITADSFQVQMDYETNQGRRQPGISPITVRNLKPDSSIKINFDWQAQGRFSRTPIFITLDPQDQIRELFDFNNMIQSRIYVAGDSLKPYLKVIFDGREIQDGEWVSANPIITVQIHDNSSALVDTGRVQLFLDEQRISFFNNSTRLSLIPIKDPEQPTLTGRLIFRPNLSDGWHELEIYVKDWANNTIFLRRSFIVARELQIFEVMNWPNPFKTNTFFTYILSQNADAAKIEIYTLGGRLIQRIDGAPTRLGFNQIGWNGEDGERDRIANGVYLYRIVVKQGTKEVSKIQKLIRME